MLSEAATVIAYIGAAVGLVGAPRAAAAVARFHYRDNRDMDQDSGRGRRKLVSLPAAQFLARLL